jgi:hypothetical protein
MTNILFVAHDPGGANVLKPVIAYFAEQTNITSYHLLLGPAAERINADGVNVRKISVPPIPTPDFPNEKSVLEEDIRRMFHETRFDAVFTATSFNSNLERLCIRIAKELGVPTLTILDFWSNYRQRFTYQERFDAPSVLFVADKRMQREAEAELPTTKVIISGNPHLLGIAARYKEARQTLQGLPIQRIRFFCENIRHYYPHKAVNEFTVMPNVLKGLFDAGFKGELYIRPHPMESREPWQDFIEREQQFSPSVRILLDTASFDEVLRDACIALGFTTMALLETASVGIPTFSYQINVPDDYFNLPFEEYGIMRLREEHDLRRVLQSSTDILSHSRQTSDEALQVIHNTVNSFL